VGHALNVDLEHRVPSLAGAVRGRIGMHKPILALLALSFAASATTQSSAQPAEPFGLVKIVAPETDEPVVEWRKLMANLGAARHELELCQTEPDHCNDAEREFLTLIREAEALKGRARIELVNQRINGEIHYTTDEAQWGSEDVWSLPIDANKDGSLDTGRGDCEDYVIAKYWALNQAGVPDAELRAALVHDNFVNEDHAVLAVRADNKWLILDNRWSGLMEDKELVPRFKPLFLVDKTGVSLLVTQFRLSDRRFIAPRSKVSTAAGP
jgi:predicted transglutaminase-like cysteine proteinase